MFPSYDAHGNRPQGTSDPIIAPVEADRRFWRSLHPLGLATLITTASFIVPLFRPLMTPDAQAATDLLTSTFCRAVELAAVGILGIRSGVNYLRAVRAVNDFNRSEAQRHRDEQTFTGKK